jgi:GTP cyclohydrolase I
MTQKVDNDKLKQACTLILEAIGEDPGREGLLETPRRFAGFWKEFIEYDPGRYGTTFEAVQADQLVIVAGLRVWSLCEHHLLPFYVDVSIGYLSEKRVLGLSKFGRIAQLCAHKLQVQERLVEEIADQVALLVKSPNVAVIATGEHLCMSMRGIKMTAKMTSSAMRGEFRTSPSLRSEFLTLSKNGR